MKNLQKRGFTLIELLVVVLIIGILAAVAVPQYQFAVKKANFTRFRAMADSIVKAAHSYYLRNGDWPSSFDELDVSLPADMSSITHPFGQTLETCAARQDGTFCCIAYPTAGLHPGYVMCGNTNLEYINAYAQMDKSPLGLRICAEPKPGSFCKKLPGATVVSITWGAMLSPQGWANLRNVVAYEID